MKSLEEPIPEPNRSFTPKSYRRFFRLAMKELREIMRDRRTIITLVLMPVLVYPLLSLVLHRFMMTSAASVIRPADEGESFVIGFEDIQQKEIFEKIAAHTESFDADQADPPDALKQTNESTANEKENIAVDRQTKQGENGNFEVTEAFTDVEWRAVVPEDDDPLEGNAEQGRTGQQNVPTPSLEEMVTENDADIGIRILNLQESPRGPPQLQLEFVYRKGEGRSEDALKYFSGEFYRWNQLNLQQRLSNRHAPAELQLSQTFVPLKIKGRKQTSSLATIIPLLLTLMTITGAVYPAIDLTAGERERGTLETLIAAPIPRMGILLGKFVAVFSVAMLTAIVNMIGIVITIWAFKLDHLIFGDQGISVGMIPQVFGLVLLFAGFFSAVLLAVTSFARSFKEAQAYLIPLMLLSLTPGVVALMPDIQLSGLLVVTPLINIVLLARDILLNEASLSTSLIAIFSTIVYGFVAISFAAKVFGTDAILFGNQNSWKSFVTRPKDIQEVCSISGAFFVLAFMLPANFIWLGIMQRGPTGIGQILMMIAGTVMLYALLPLGYLVWKRISLVSGLGFRFGKAMAYPAAILLGCATGILLIQICASSRWVTELFASDTDVARDNLNRMMVEMGRHVVEEWKQTPRILLLIALSIAPAVCEELFFRGVLFRSLQKKMPIIAAISISGLMFGIFHTLSANVLSFDRFIPSMLMGIILAIVAYRSQSLLPGIILHMLHNLIIVSAALSHDQLIDLNIITQEQQTLPLFLVVLAVIFAIVGFLLLPRRPDPNPQHTSVDAEPAESTLAVEEEI